MNQSFSNRKLLAVLVLMVVFGPLAIDIFLPALPLMAADLNVPLYQMQWSVSAYILSMGFGQLISGPLADRYGRKPVAIGGVWLYLLGALITAMSLGLSLHLLGRLIQGLGACAITVSAMACVRDRFEPLKSAMLYSYLNGAICCIPAAAPILGDILSVQYGWRSTFYFMIVYGLIAVTFITWGLKETRPQHIKIEQPIFSLNRYWQVLKHPVFLFNAILVMIAMAIIIAYVSGSPAWIIINLQRSQSEFVFWFSINAVLNIAACLLAPKVLSRFGPRLTCGAGMLALVCGGIMMVMMLNWSHPLGFMTPILFSSIGFSLLMGTCASQALAPFGEKAGTASALYGFIQMSGAALLFFVVQSFGLNEAEQVGLLMFSVLPLYLLWKLPKVKMMISLPEA